jgi:hypothetical protein
MGFMTIKDWTWRRATTCTGGRPTHVNPCLISGWKCLPMVRKCPRVTWKRFSRFSSRIISQLSRLKSSKKPKASIT